ncbi:MAG: FHA domain-containing protein [Bdellovibrionales bacterium]|nr:FHA domain-containing protein [Bdellovibrionales bacterium]
MEQAIQNKTSKIFRVCVLSPNDIQTAYVPLEKFSIGSMPKLPIVLREKGVEKRHLVVSCVQDQIWITDQNTATGTKVNGNLIPSNIPHRYCPGDRITVGESQFSIQIDLYHQVFDEELGPNRLMDAALEKVKLVEQEKLKDIEKQFSNTKLECDALKTQALDKADEIISIAELRGREIVANMEQEFESRFQAVEQERLRIEDERKTININLEKLRQEIVLKSDQQAEESAKKIIDDAKLKATEYLSKVKVENQLNRERMIAQATTDAESIRRQAEVQGENILREYQEKAAQALDLAETHANEKCFKLTRKLYSFANRLNWMSSP